MPLKAPRDSFNQMASIYDKYRGVDLQLLIYLADEVRKGMRKGRVYTLLDVGCGTGRFSIQLAQMLGVKVTGVDVSEKMLSQARDKHPEGTWLQQAIEESEFSEGSFDYALMSYVIHHLKDPERALRLLYRCMKKPGGKLFIVTDSYEAFKSSIYHRLMPRILDIDLGRFPDIAALCGTLKTIGFTPSVAELSETRTVATQADVQSLIDKTRSRFVSTLTYLTDQELEEGVEKIVEYFRVELAKGPVVENRVKTVVVATT